MTDQADPKKEVPSKAEAGKPDAAKAKASGAPKPAGAAAKAKAEGKSATGKPAAAKPKSAGASKPTKTADKAQSDEKQEEAAEATEATPAPDRQTVLYQTSVVVAVLAGITSLLVTGVLLNNHFSGGTVESLLEDRELAGLKKDLMKNPKDDQLKLKIRKRDWELRNNLFGRLHFDDWGTTFLFCALIVLLTSIKVAAAQKKKLPNPVTWGPRVQGTETKIKQVSRFAVIGTAALTGGFLLVLGLGSGGLAFMMEDAQAGPDGFPDGGDPQGAMPDAGDAGDTASKPAAPKGVFPGKEEIRKQWPRFRGPGGSGVYEHGRVATEWDVPSGKNILWKVPVPLIGYSSPVIWKERLFLTGATAKQREVYCLSTVDGKMLWKADAGEVTRQKEDAPEVFEPAGFAACTPVTDGMRVYAMFANGDVVAFDYEGKRVWAVNLGLAEDTYGHASSLAMWQDKVLVQFDHDGEGEPDSALYALESATGEVAWKEKRAYGCTWTSPIVIETGKGDQFITATTPFVIANDPATGKELWKAKVLDGEVAPSPIFAGGRVIACMEDAGIAAIIPGGKGDVTADHVEWQVEGDLPATSSPVSDGKLIWAVTAGGILTCWQLSHGTEVWKKELESGGYSSPTLAGGNLYLTNEDGDTLVLKVGDEYKEVGKGKAGEKVAASLAFSGDRIFIRGEKHLICVGGAAAGKDAK